MLVCLLSLVWGWRMIMVQLPGFYCKGEMTASKTWGSISWVLFLIKALLLWPYIRAPDLWKLPDEAANQICTALRVLAQKRTLFELQELIPHEAACGGCRVHQVLNADNK